MSLIRVCAVQFGVAADVADNLRVCLAMIDRAAQNAPQLMVLPEFINHIAWYNDPEHCRQVAVSLEDDFIGQIAGRAAHHHCYIKINVTLKREQGQVTGSNILFDPAGTIIGLNDKQILMGNENDFLTPAGQIAPILETTIGRIGMYACMDGVIPEVARALAVRRPHLLLNSLNSFAYDEATLHIPVRAAENKVYVVAANKVGSLVPETMRETVAARLKIDPIYLEGAGESQIVAPDGRVLAKAPRRGEAIVWADLDLSVADDKMRPDGTDILASRRPALYRPLGQPPQPSPAKQGADKVLVGVIQLQTTGSEAIAQAAAYLKKAEAKGVSLVVLPELFHLTQLSEAEKESADMIRALQAVIQNCFVAASIVADGTHLGVLFDKNGLVLQQPQLHPSGRHQWSKLGNELQVADLPWGRVALVVGNDAIYPETFRLTALQGVAVVGVPTQILEPWESSLGFRERAAENRMNVVVSGRDHSGIYAISEDFTLWTEWKNRPFDGNLNTPLVTLATQNGLTTALVHPAAATNKMVSYRTNVLHGRPWHLAGPIVQETLIGGYTPR